MATPVVQRAEVQHRIAGQEILEIENTRYLQVLDEDILELIVSVEQNCLVEFPLRPGLLESSLDSGSQRRWQDRGGQFCQATFAFLAHIRPPG